MEAKCKMLTESSLRTQVDIHWLCPQRYCVHIQDEHVGWMRRVRTAFSVTYQKIGVDGFTSMSLRIHFAGIYWLENTANLRAFGSSLYIEDNNSRFLDHLKRKENSRVKSSLWVTSMALTGVLIGHGGWALSKSHPNFYAGQSKNMSARTLTQWSSAAFGSRQCGNWF